MTSWRHIPVQAFLLYGFAAIIVIRLVVVFTMGIMPQDAYYYYYSEHPDLSYFDHPPGVAIHLWLSTAIFGKHVWSLKLADFLMSALTLWAVYRLGARFLSAQRNVRLLYIFGSTLTLTAVSIVTTPDVPLLLMWTLSLLAIYHALQRRQVILWALAGLVSGLAFDCKYTALYLPVAMIGFLMLSRTYRKYLWSWHLLSYLVCFVAALLPVILWNIQHDWASFRFQSGDRVSSIMEFRLRPQYFLGTVGHQMLMLLPVLFITILLLTWKYVRRTWIRKSLPDDDTLFLVCFSIPLIIGFLFLSWIYWVKINWLLPAHITATILAVRFLRKKPLRWHMISAVAAHGLLLVQVLFYPVHLQTDDTWWGWNTLAAEVRTLHDRYPDHFLFSRDGYKTTAVLNFYLDTQVFASNVIGEHALQYSVRDKDLTHLEGKNALFLDSQNIPRHFDDAYTPPEELLPCFDSTRIVTVIPLRRKEKTLRQFVVVECFNYQPPSSGTGSR